MADEQQAYDEKLRNDVRKALDDSAIRGVSGLAALSALSLNIGDLIGGSAPDRHTVDESLNIVRQIIERQARAAFAHWQAEDAKRLTN